MPDDKNEFKFGGFCKLKAEAAAKVDSTPARLLKAGWPNKFLIVEIYEEKDKGKLLRLDPCCGWMIDLRDDEKNACEAHPAKFFEVLPGHISEDIENEAEAEVAEEEVVGPAGGRYTGLGVGDSDEDLVGVEYVNGETTKTFFVRCAGKAPIMVRGTGAQRLSKIFSKLGIL